MDLRDDIPTNLEDLVDQLRQLANREQPAPAVWEEVRQRLDDLAMFTETFLIPRIPVPTRYLVLAPFERQPQPIRPLPELVTAVAGNNGDETDAT